MAQRPGSDAVNGTSPAGPLAGVRVLEVAGLGPGPFAAMLLADLGADVVKLDRPGDQKLIVAPRERDLINRGKRSLVVDLRAEFDRELALALAARADIMLEPFRPGVAERLGIGPDECLERNPRLVYGRMTGWGQHGPAAHTAGHDISYLAPTGALHAIGPAATPVPPLNIVGDYAGGSLYLVVGLLAALVEARRSGEGQVVDCAIVDGAAHLMTMFHSMLDAGTWQDQRESNLLDGGAPFYAVYETADGGHMAVGAIEDHFYAEFARLLGVELDPEQQHDRSCWPQTRERIRTAFGTRTRQEWTDIFAGSDACVSPVLRIGESASDPHLSARGTYVEVNGVTQPAPAPRFSRTPPPAPGPPALLDEHRDEILADWLTAKAAHQDTSIPR